MQEIVGKIFLDDVALVAATNHEIMDAMGGVHLHDVPQDRLSTDLNHWLWPEMGFFGNASAEPPSKYHCFQSITIF